MVLFLDYNKKLKTDHSSICGIINGPIYEKNTSTGKILQRIPVILPCLTQALIDLWSDRDGIRPTFSFDWKIFQVIIFTNINYVGDITVSDKVIKVFRRGTRYPNERKRYIWLSDDKSNFWVDPIKNSDFNICQSFETWPRRLPEPEGTLKMSSGSVITCKFAQPVKTEDIEPFGFEGLQRLHTKLKRSHRGYINLLSGKPASDKLIFER